MRVIAGNHKGRQLKPVPGNGTRPTTDKAKEALFQVLGPYFEGEQVLDLFAGSGGLGIEALSRGATKCVFVDAHPKAVQTIHYNLNALSLENCSEVFRTDAFRAIKAAGKRELAFDYIFLDPPYRKVSYEDLLQAILENDLLNPGGVIVCEHDAGEHLPERVGILSQFKSEIYGTNIGIAMYKEGES